MKILDLKVLKITFLTAALGALVLSGCKKDDDDDNGLEQELITTVILKFTNLSNNQVSEFFARDPDGPGGMPPIVDPVTLSANTNYRLELEFLDESDPDDVEDITEEIREEDDEHLVCFFVTGAVPKPTITDTDGDGKPLGLVSTLNTGAAGTGSLRVVLRHEPNKNAADPCNTGDTDADVTFQVTVQ
jgi:hypothetical protein